MRILKYPFHPYVFSVTPALALFSQNRSKLAYDELLFSLAFIALLVFLISFIVNLLIRNKTRTAILMTILSFITFGFVEIFNNWSDWLPLSEVAKNETVMLVIGSVIILLSFLLMVRKRADMKRTTSFLNLYSVIVLILALISISGFEIERARKMKELQSQKDITKFYKDNSGDIGTLSNNSKSRPDIYYIVLDTYARDDVLKNIYSFDNSAFIKELEKRDFKVSKTSSTNYTFTQLSLSSSLNMEYIDYLTDVLGKKSKNPSIPYQMIKNNEAQKFVRSKGYETVIFSTGWGPTKRNRYVDTSYAFLPYLLDEFNRVLLESTTFHPLLRPAIKNFARRRILYNFDRLSDVPKNEKPTFAVAHFILPHQPYLFDRKGNPVSLGKFEMGGDVWKYKDAYIDQLVYTNNKTLKVVDKILKDSQEPPIIILLSDHGPSSTRGWDDPSDKLLNERMNILTAIYTPEKNIELFDEDITPVNYLRMVFNHYLEGDFERLDDINYFSSKQRPYEFIDVSDKLRRNGGR